MGRKWSRKLFAVLIAVVLVQTASQAHTGTHRSRKFDAPATVTVQYYNSEKTQMGVLRP